VKTRSLPAGRKRFRLSVEDCAFTWGQPTQSQTTPSRHPRSPGHHQRGRVTEV